MSRVRADYRDSWTLHQAFGLRLIVFFILTLLVKSSSFSLCLAHFFLWMRLNVRFIRGREIFLRTGRLWYQNVLVGGFMSRRLPWASSSFTGSMCRRIIFPRASLCRKIKSRAAPKETEAMGQRGSSSFSSSRCSPMWSRPSLYLVEKEEVTHSAGGSFPKFTFISHLLTRTKLNMCPVVVVTASRMYSSVGVHGEVTRLIPEYV